MSDKKKAKLKRLVRRRKRIPRFFLEKVNTPKCDSTVKLGMMQVFGTRNAARMFERISRGVPQENEVNIAYLKNSIEAIYNRYLNYYNIPRSDEAFREFVIVVSQICEDEYESYLQGKAPFKVDFIENGYQLTLTNGGAKIPVYVAGIRNVEEAETKFALDIFKHLLSFLGLNILPRRENLIRNVCIGAVIRYRRTINRSASAKKIFAMFADKLNRHYKKKVMLIKDLDVADGFVSTFSVIISNKVELQVFEDKRRYVDIKVC